MALSAQPHSLLAPATSVATAVLFLRDCLGLELKFQDGDRYAAFEFAGTTLAILGETECIVAAPAICLRVQDLDTALRDSITFGAELVVGAQQGPHERRAVIRVGSLSVVLSQKVLPGPRAG